MIPLNCVHIDIDLLVPWGLVALILPLSALPAVERQICCNSFFWHLFDFEHILFGRDHSEDALKGLAPFFLFLGFGFI